MPVDSITTCDGRLLVLNPKLCATIGTVAIMGDKIMRTAMTSDLILSVITH
jgi:hypothetical protein